MRQLLRLPTLCAAVLFSSHSFAAGLDPGFGSGGRQVVTTFPDYSSAGDVAIQADGRIVASGAASRNVATVRFMPNGALDTSFNATGTRTDSVGSIYPESASALALQPDGKVVIGGQYAVNPNPPIGFPSPMGPFLLRYTADGSRDMGFGTSGAVLAYSAYGEGTPLRIVLQPDGKIAAITTRQMALHNPDGSTASTPAPFSGDFRAADLARQADGKLFVFGTSINAVPGHSEIGFIRYSAAGVPELTALQSTGEFSVQAEAGAVQPDGKVLVAGGSAYESIVMRLLANGALDTSFGTGGVLRASEASWGAIAVQPDGKILLRSSVEIRRLLPSGSPDDSFGIRGRFGVGLPGFGALRFALQQDGRILLAGSDGKYPSTYRMVVARVDPGAVPILTVDPPVLDFGTRPQNTPTTIALAISNPHATPLTVSNVSATAPYSVSHDCGTLASGGRCTAAVTFTPPPGSAVDSALVFTTSSGVFEVPARGFGDPSLVRHFYLSILRREADTPGRLYWNQVAYDFSALLVGTSEAWFGMAARFFGSAEYVAFQRNDTEFVRDLYRTFFDREMEETGRAYWTGQLAAGLPRDALLANFMLSAEFQGFVARIFGTAAVAAHRQTVLDFYRGFLARVPDGDGFNYWSGRFRSALCSGGGDVASTAEGISSSFTNGAEYANRKRSNAKFVSDMYNAFMRRGGDLDGIRYWTGQLDSGARTRDDVRQQFRASPEFTARVNAMVGQGCPQ